MLKGNRCPLHRGKMEVGRGKKGLEVLESYLPECALDCTKQSSSKPDLFPWQLLRSFKDESVGGRGGWAEDRVGTMEKKRTGLRKGGIEVHQRGLETQNRLGSLTCWH